MRPILLVLIAISTLKTEAQSPSGFVFNKFTGEGIYMAKISFLNSAGETDFIVFADEEGKFSVDSIPAGTYTLKVRDMEYLEETFSDITVPFVEPLRLAFGESCEYMKSENDKTCPQCGKKNMVLPIVYGLPVSLKGEGDTWISGGCVISGCDPNWYCKRCKKEF